MVSPFIFPLHYPWPDQHDVSFWMDAWLVVVMVVVEVMAAVVDVKIAYTSIYVTQ